MFRVVWDLAVLLKLTVNVTEIQNKLKSIIQLTVAVMVTKNMLNLSVLYMILQLIQFGNCNT